MRRIPAGFVVLPFVVALLLGVLSSPFRAVGAGVPQMPTGRLRSMEGDRRDGQVGSGQMEDGQTGDKSKSDSTERKPRKPLESYFFDDSTRKQELFSWTVDMYRNKLHAIALDTMQQRFQVDYPYLKRGVGDIYLGQLGGPSLPFDYKRRPQYRDNEMASAFDAYYFKPENVPFYNVKKVFTQFSYNSSGQVKVLEENFKIVHAQNISPSSGFNFNYRSQGARGIYTWQKARDKNMSIAFSHTGKRYSLHAGYIYNMVDINENGGIVDDRMITDTIIDMPRTIPIRMAEMEARNKIRDNTYYLVHSYGVPLKKLSEDDFSIADRSSFFLGHALEYNRWVKKYSDVRALDSGQIKADDFYDNWYLNTLYSSDSTFESRLSNRLFVQIQPWDRDGVVGLLDAGVGLDFHHYYMFDPSQMITGDISGENKSSLYVYGSVEGKIKRYFSWGGDIKFYPIGYRNGDLKIGANASASAFIRGKPITLQGSFGYDLREPGYWMQKYVSNHFTWSNSFAKENESRLELTLKAPLWGLEAGVSQSIVSNKIYFDASSLPAQSTNSVSVTGVYLQKDFALGGLHLNNRVLLQWSTDHLVAPVPMAAAFLSWFFEFNVVRDVLRLQIGLDGRYNTSYYAPGYSPALAQFYNQREQQTGNYPMVDVFLNAKWKRMRIFVKYMHLNENMFGGRNYFNVPHYPLNQPVLKLGLSWAFYD